MADPPIGWAETKARLSQDAVRLRRFQRSKFGYAPLIWFLDPAWLCVFLYRLSHLAWQSGHRKTGRLFMQLNSLLTGADMQPPAEIGGGLLVPSPCGVNISGKVGRNLTALALAGIGGSVRDRDIGAGIGLPVIGDDVAAHQFTGIQGSIRLGDRVVADFGAGAVVDLPAGARLVLAVDPVPGTLPVATAQPPAPACRHDTWSVTKAAFDADVTRYLDEESRYLPASARQRKRLGAILTNPLLALWVHRVSHWLHRNDHRFLANLLGLVNLLLHKVTIPPSACIGDGALIPHLAGTLFDGRAGNGLTLYASSLCAPLAGGETPLLGDWVTVGGQAAALGGIAVGDHVQLGPKAQLCESVPADTQVWSSMARGTLQHEAAPAPEVQDASLARGLGSRPWHESLRRFQADFRRLKQHVNRGGEFAQWLMTLPALLSVGLFRLSHCLHATGWRRPSRWCWLANAWWTGADLAPECEIGGGLLIPYPAGVALQCRAGTDLTLFAVTGIGTALDAEDRLRPLDRAPQLGDGVTLFPHSGIYGPVRIGDGVRVLPGCIVTKPVAECVTLAPRALKFRRRPRVAQSSTC
jgi:serine acetyltransferase